MLLIALTLVFGRFFCGWVCPLGTLNHFIAYFKGRKTAARIKSNRYNRWQTIKYYILIGFLAAAFFTTLQIGWLDPIAFLTRSLATSIIPATNALLQSGLNLLYDSGIGFLGTIADGLYFIFDVSLFSYGVQVFHYGALIGIIFLAVILLNRLITRFWCRYLCPLGALLGVFSKVAIFGLEKNNAACTDCKLCLKDCQGGDDPIGGVPWQQHECHLCLNCQSICAEGALKFKFFPNTETTARLSTDFTRRRVLTGVAAGAAVLPLLRVSSHPDINYDPFLVRPPGSLNEEEFLARCIRCGACMKVCPTNAIQPTLLEAGAEGIWSPFMVMRMGYCEQTCVLCSQVCPTGAIWPLDEAAKLGKNGGKFVSIGTAFFDHNRCIPYAFDRPCIVCQEHCPTSPKAIFLKEEKVIKRDGTEIILQRPYIDPELCWGCGLCEYVCPIKDKAGVYVTSIGETRMPARQFLLDQSKT